MATPSLLQVNKKDSLMWVAPKETRTRIDWNCGCPWVAELKKLPCFDETKAMMDCKTMADDFNNPTECWPIFKEWKTCMEKNPNYQESLNAMDAALKD
eukprot:TRINITY_DN1063_c0_g1_i1.p1 TRINITY_DN1063_c0_g1~~TRINITY_DN1063_c0_g1_i1.p1  ORF type:complete len:112 (-),score=28.84 TRINITY_DN1063_c0_g1_i1:108-401(-)